nr:shell protein 2B [Novocrania anomala]
MGMYEHYGPLRRMFFVSCTFFVLFLETSFCTISLRPLSTLYLPYTYNPSPQYALNKGVAEQSSYDAARKTVYTVGENAILYITDISAPERPLVIQNYSLPVIATDVEVCGDFVALSGKPSVVVDPGLVMIFKIYNKPHSILEKLHEISVGALPDMLTFTKDCRTILVANEGEAGKNSLGRFEDPKGSVSIIKFQTSNLAGNYTLKTADFRAFDSRADEYVARGVRWVYRGQGTNNATRFSQDLEPEYITLSKDESMAYIALQENNAMAVLDMTTLEIKEIYPLGFKQWNKTAGLDASDKDSGINIHKWPVYGMYQPDTIKYVVINGVGYIVTANEGDEKKYKVATHGLDWEENTRARDLVNQISSNAPSNLRTYVDAKSDLGRLKVSTVDGKESDGNYSKLFAYGGRSFSIWKAADLSLVYDSGSDVEEKTMQYFRSIFNSELDNELDTPEDSFDSRSDNKGPECESLAIVHNEGNVVIFVGNERTSSIIIYSVNTSDDAIMPKFQSMYRAGELNDTWANMYGAHNVGDIDPEDIRFIPSSDSPNGQPLLLVSGSVSGTLSLYQVEGLETMPTAATTDNQPGTNTTPEYTSAAAPVVVHGYLATVLMMLLMAAGS